MKNSFEASPSILLLLKINSNEVVSLEAHLKFDAFSDELHYWLVSVTASAFKGDATASLLK